MLEQLRRGTGTWMAKILLGLLVASFAVWGIGDNLVGGGSNEIASVGSTKITVQRFQTAYQNGLARLSQQVGRRLTPTEARVYGLDRTVLSRLMGSAAIDNHVADLGLALSDQAIIASVRDDPIFHDADGKYSNDVFRQVMRRIDMTPEGFIAAQRKEQLRRQVSNVLGASVVVPEPLINVLHRYQNEQRIIKYFDLDLTRQGKVADPTDAAMKSYYVQNKRQFVTPFYRKVALLVVTRDMAAKQVPVTDNDLKAAYRRTKSSYDIPERRVIQQISFPDQAAANKAYKILAKARDFHKAAAKLGFKTSDYELGEFTKADMIDQDLAAVAFKLGLNKLSKPVEGGFSIVLLRVTKITKGKESTFAQMKDRVRATLAADGATKQLQKLYELVDGERGAGKTLRESADSLKLKFYDLPKIDRSGNGADGKPALQLADLAKVVKAIFGGGVGVENEVVELSDGGYAWFDILGVTEPKQKTFEQVKADIKAIMIDLAQRKQIAKVARETVAKINNGSPIEQVAKAMKLKLTTSKAIKRRERLQDLSDAAMQRAFTLPKGKAASAQSVSRSSRTILLTVDISAPTAPTKEETKALTTALQQQLIGDVINQYVSGLLVHYGQEKNDKAISRATGLDAYQGQ